MEELFRAKFGQSPEKIEPLTAAGSNRRYWRLSAAGVSAVGVKGTDAAENRAFIAFAKHFKTKGINVPEIFAVSDDGLSYLQEDLGDTSLFSCLSDREMVKKAVAALPAIQVKGAEGLDFGVCYPVREFDGRSVMFDLNYFKYCFLKLCGLEFDEMLLQDDLENLCADLLKVPSDSFMYRDFQSRNVMVRDSQPWFIDFQGGRKGPLQYDLASFVWQAKAAFPDDFKEELVATYIEALKSIMPIDEDSFRENLRLFVFFRTLQVLGAYGFRGLYEKKPHFIESIPFAMKNLSDLLDTIPAGKYTYLVSVLRRLVESRRVEKPVARIPEGLAEGMLAIDVMSFSYKKGIPDDISGNGGGYVFDCRGMHNPGRYEEYKHLTGLDQPVIDFLEANGEVQQFIGDVCAVVDRHADCFLARGFNHLSVFFGCTGGQHRSVYCAEHVAAHFKEKYGDRVAVRLVHRERGIERVL